MIRLSLSSLSCRRGGRLLFEDVSLEVGPSDLLHIKGTNGSGKSSLLRLIAGFGTPDTGVITLEENGTRLSAADCLYLLEEVTALKPAETLASSLRNWALLMGFSPSTNDLISAAEAVNMLPLIDIETRRYSTGQKRRAALARLALGGRPIWLLDEPMNGLDKASREMIHHLITAHRSNGGLVLVASHDSVFENAKDIVLDDYRPKNPIGPEPYFDPEHPFEDDEIRA